MDSKRIGFVGMGVMGAPMARNLAAAGHAVTVYDTDGARAQAAASGGGLMRAASLRELGTRSDIVITMLPKGDVVRQVVCGPDGVGEALASGSLLLDTSSSEPWLTRETSQVLDGRGGSGAGLHGRRRTWRGSGRCWMRWAGRFTTSGRWEQTTR